MADLVRHNARRGTAAVEAALMPPMVMFITLALVTYGWVSIKSGQINNAARQGPRVVARDDATNQAVKNHVAALMTNAGIPFDKDADLTVAPDTPLENMACGTILAVTITVPYQGTDAELISMPFMPVAVNLQIVASMSKEGEDDRDRMNGRIGAIGLEKI